MKFFAILCLSLSMLSRGLRLPSAERWLNAGERSWPATQDVCSKDKFALAVNQLVDSQFFNKSFATTNASKYYDTELWWRRCKPQKKISDKKLIINVVFGTTGTRWVTQLFHGMGFDTCHLPRSDPETWHNYDMVSDSTVSINSYMLTQAYPNAVFIMGTRDSYEWQASKLKHHADEVGSLPQPCDHTTTESLNGIADPAIPSAMVVFEAFVKCIIPPERLFIYNIFNTPNDVFVRDLAQYLNYHGLMTPERSKWVETLQMKLAEMTLEEMFAMQDQGDQLSFQELQGPDRKCSDLGSRDAIYENLGGKS